MPDDILINGRPVRGVPVAGPVQTSNRNPENRYERPEQVIPWAMEQWCRLNLNTALPGIVQSYDAVTKRAKVQPALRTTFHPVEDRESPTGFTQPAPEPKPPIVNVPMRQCATGGHLQHHAIQAGDAVLLIFAQRGIQQFKETWALADPARGAFFDMQDAMAIPWGSESIVPVRETGILWQNADGSAYVSLDGDDIRLVTGESSVTLTPAEVTLRARQVTIQADRIDDEAY